MDGNPCETISGDGGKIYHLRNPSMTNKEIAHRLSVDCYEVATRGTTSYKLPRGTFWSFAGHPMDIVALRVGDHEIVLTAESIDSLGSAMLAIAEPAHTIID